MKIKDMLAGGNPRTLKGVADIIAKVTKTPELLDELFTCLFVDDEIVRLRASDALEKICVMHPDWFVKYVPHLLNNVSKFRQSSVQWHLAQMLAEIPLTKSQQIKAIDILVSNLEALDDWIVTNLTLESLAHFTRLGAFDVNKMVEILNKYEHDKHKSVVSRTKKIKREFMR